MIEVGELRIKSIEELPLEEKVVICRVDVNVPLDGKKVSDDTRIRAILPTLNFLFEKNARVTLVSHLGRPNGKVVDQFTLLPVAEHLASLIGREVIFPDDCIGDGVRRILQQQKSRDVVLLENLRFHPGEEANQKHFAKELKNNFEVYVNDAFGALHRAHASTSALPQHFEARGAGFLVLKELKCLTSLLQTPEHPYAVILGGAKVSDKIRIMEKFLNRVDMLLLGGAMVFTFLRALGHEVGNSLVEDSMIEPARRILDIAKERGIEVIFPKDFRLGKSIENPGDSEIIEGLDIPKDRVGLDVGPATIQHFADKLKTVKVIFWNGPLGLYEKPPFDQGTVGLAKVLSDFSMIRVIGGGDCAAAVTKAGLKDRMTHISTGGGATLKFLEGKPLPGLKALAM